MKRIRRDFYGTELELHQREGDLALLMTSEQIGVGLDYSGSGADQAERVNQIYRRHPKELGPFKVKVPGTATVYWHEEAIYMIACFARTKVAEKFRIWIVQTCSDLNSGRAALVTPEQVAALIDAVRRAEREELQSERVRLLLDQHRAHTCRMDLTRNEAKIIAQALNARREQKERELAELSRITTELDAAEAGRLPSDPLAQRFFFVGATNAEIKKALLDAAAALPEDPAPEAAGEEAGAA